MGVHVHFARRGDVEVAIAAFRKAVQLDPSALGPRLNLAMLLRTRMRLHDARREYEELLRLYPGSGVAHEGLAMTLFLTGDAPEAWRHANQARRLRRELNPEFVHALENAAGMSR